LSDTTPDVFQLHATDMVAPPQTAAAMMTDKGLRRPLLGLAGQVSMLMAQRNVLPEEIAETAGVQLSLVRDVMMGMPFDLTYRQFCMIATALDAKCAIQFQVQTTAAT
jgi:hypothetical protein